MASSVVAPAAAATTAPPPPTVVLPPPPPPPPPPLPPPPPPPPSPSATKDDETITQQQRTLLAQSATLLERSRSLNSELESTILFSTTLLSNPNGLDTETADSLPGGVRDAWMALSESSRMEDDEDNGAIMGGGSGGKDENNELEIPLGRGQLGRATKTAALSCTLVRAADVAKVMVKNGVEDRPIYERATAVAAGAGAAGASSRAGGDVNVLLDGYYERLREVREYHARNDTAANAGAAVAQTLTVGAVGAVGDGGGGGVVTILSSSSGADNNTTNDSNRRGGTKRKYGNPAADGYDLSSLIIEETGKVRDGDVYSAEEVLGKYLDLTTLHDRTLGMKHAFAPPPPLPTRANEGSGTDQKNQQDDNEKKKGEKKVVQGMIPYVDFLNLLTSGLSTSITEESKLKDRRKYVRFLISLQLYLESFLKRTSPLLDVNAEVIRPAIKEFEKEWSEKGGVMGWECKKAESIMATISAEGGSDTGTSSGSGGVDLSGYATAEDLEKALSGDELKAELSRLGMKCGGTVADRAKRLFQTKDTPLDQLPNKLFVKNKKPPIVAAATDKDSKSDDVVPTGNNGKTAASASLAVSGGGNERRVDIARLEIAVTAMLDQVRPTLDATARRAERRLTQTLNEREREVEEEIHGTYATLVDNNKRQRGDNDNDDENNNENENDEDSDDEDDDDAPIYNPKGVPLGWDGKPIPYWLFKLHGLNHFFPCEICGNESYRGRRNFEKHFTESKHAYGMRCLGIPNTKHFHGVTKIEDAVELWKTLQSTVKEDMFDGTKEEEYEDSHGNVLSRATYEDLARQGLL